jgi:hypothetical protein
MEIRRMGVIEGDGVHLTTRVCRNAAVILCNRIRKIEHEKHEVDEQSFMDQSQGDEEEKNSVELNQNS